MPSAKHAQFFSGYFAQGVQRVGKDFLRHSASSALGSDPSQLQIFYNLLPEFGSLPWILKPGLMFVAERFLGAWGQRVLTALCALLSGLIWLRLATSPIVGSEFLLCTGLVSLGSAVVDGLVDGRVAEESRDGESAAASRYLCECGTFVGSIFVGVCAWLLSLGHAPMLILTAVAWAAVAPCVLLLDRTASSSTKAGSSGKAVEATGEPLRLSSLLSLLNGAVGWVSLLAFVSCLSPTLDFFLFRQQAMGLSASQQSLVSMAGALGWWLGTSSYRHRIAVGRPVHVALRTCLLWWPASALLQVAIAALVVNASITSTTTFAVPLAMAEKMASEFCKALTYMPCTVLMQLHSPPGYESTAFTLMQWSGTVGQVLGRNLEYLLMGAFGVSPTAGFASFWRVAAAAAVWRPVTAVLLRTFVLGSLAGSERKTVKTEN